MWYSLSCDITLSLGNTIKLNRPNVFSFKIVLQLLYHDYLVDNIYNQYILYSFILEVHILKMSYEDPTSQFSIILITYRIYIQRWSPEHLIFDVPTPLTS